MILDFLGIAIQFGGAAFLCFFAIGIVDTATTSGHSDWHEDRQEL